MYQQSVNEPIKAVQDTSTMVVTGIQDTAGTATIRRRCIK
jgi:hypothetical protein